MNYLKTIDLMRVGQRYRVTRTVGEAFEGVYIGGDEVAVDIAWWSPVIERVVVVPIPLEEIANVAEAPLPQVSSNSVDVLQDGKVYDVWTTEGSWFRGTFVRFWVQGKRNMRASADFRIIDANIPHLPVGERRAFDVSWIAALQEVVK